MRRKLAAQNVRILTYVNPFFVDIAKLGRPGRNLFAEAHDRGYLVRETKRPAVHDSQHRLFSGLLDLTHPEARKWWKDIIPQRGLGDRRIRLDGGFWRSAAV